jgi:predicted negative regulator of RcsB-dependent stress response
MTEQEQIEILKRWIKQYSLVILAGVVIASLAISGWRYWQQRQQKILTHASAIYDEMLNYRAQNDTQATLVQAEKLFSHYPKTSYGQLAGLMLARDAVNNKNYLEAEKQLTWVLDHSNIPSLRQIARIRLARIMIATQKFQAALDTLKKVDDKSFDGLTDETRGDAYLAMNDRPKAHEFYQHALDELPNAEVIRPVLRMKYDNLTTGLAQTSTLTNTQAATQTVSE